MRKPWRVHMERRWRAAGGPEAVSHAEGLADPYGDPETEWKGRLWGPGGPRRPRSLEEAGL